MDKIISIVDGTPDLIRRARRSFISLHDNQQILARALRQVGDAHHLQIVRRNLRILQAVNGAMERFHLISKEQEGEEKTKQPSLEVNTSQLQEDVIASEASGEEEG